MPPAMTPKEIDSATKALVEAVKSDAAGSAQAVEDRQAELAPGLSTGANIPGGRNYQGFVAPTVPALTKTLVAQGKQEVLRGAIRDAMNAAEKEYEDSQFSYRARQREFQKKQAQKAKQRQRQSDAAMAAQAALARGGGQAGASVGGVSLVGSGGGAARMQQRKDGGFNFQDANGKAISAMTFSQIMGIDFSSLLAQMARAGDKGAGRVMTQSDGSKEYANLYRALTWR